MRMRNDNGQFGDSPFNLSPALTVNTTMIEEDELNLGLIIGVSVGALVLLVLLGVGGYFIMVRR